MTAKQQQLDRWMFRLAFVLATVGLGVANRLSAQLPNSDNLPMTTTLSGGSTSAGSFEIQLQSLQNESSAPVVTALTASHEGRFLAVAGDDHAIRVIDVRSGHEIQTFIGHIDWIQSLVFVQEAGTADSVAPLLYSAGNDGRVLEWKYEFPLRSREVLRLPYAVRSITVSTDQKLLAIAGFSEEILVWDLASNLLRHRLKCDGGDQRCVKFSPDGSRLLCGGRHGELHVWDSHSGELLVTRKLHTGRITTAAFSVDGTKVTSVGEDRRIVRYNLADQQTEWQRELGRSKLQSMCLINDSLVAAAGSDNKIRLFDVLSDSIVTELDGHTGTVAVMAPCGEFLASGSYDTTVRVWDLEAIGRRRGTDVLPVVHAPLKMDDNLRIR